ncbi:MAG: four helix bundle protein [Bacteroidales bacterium]|nr:four helix bundle protein [Bacteroidales bacterium]
MENQEEKIQSFFRFEDLRIYGKAVDYATWLANALEAPRNESEKTMVSSFMHSAFDISLNIAEGSSRAKVNFEHYLKISKTAIRECVVYTTMAKNCGLLSMEQCETSRELLMEMTRMIGALIISVQRSLHQREDADEAQPSEFVSEF